MTCAAGKYLTINGECERNFLDPAALIRFYQLVMKAVKIALEGAETVASVVLLQWCYITIIHASVNEC